MSAVQGIRDLHKREKIHVSFSGREFATRKAGWDLGFRVEKNYRARMCDDPWDFYNGFEWGVDLIWAGSQGSLAHPDQLAQALMREVGATASTTTFCRAMLSTGRGASRRS